MIKVKIFLRRATKEKHDVGHLGMAVSDTPLNT
jgi:hypothetical protein